MKLTLELKQKQKMSPQQIQSVIILQMGTQELQSYVESLLMENPTLELESSEQRSERSELLQKMDWLKSTDRQNRWYHQEDAASILEYVSALDDENLYDHLRSQIDIFRLPPRLRIAVDGVLSGLNSNGYLEESVEELSSRCGQSPEIIQQAEQLVQALEPTGVATRTLSECLANQLRKKGEFGLPLTIALHHLESVAKNHYGQIAKETGASLEDIQQACNQIRQLDPRPGSMFARREPPEYILPDLLVTENNGYLEITSGDEFLPVLRVSSYYHELAKTTEDAEVRDYLEGKIKQSVITIKSIEQRRATLLGCAQVILKRQKQFFSTGTGNLLPLTLSDVANEINIHESTVSRAIRDKYIQCVHGTFPLSYFFSRSVPAGEGKMSAAEVKNAIRELIEQEDCRKPLSDQKICDILAERKVDISRRAVAKYRDEMGIPSTSGRKVY